MKNILKSYRNHTLKQVHRLVWKLWNRFLSWWGVYTCFLKSLDSAMTFVGKWQDAKKKRPAYSLLWDSVGFMVGLE